MSLGNRYLNQFQYTMEKDTVTLYGSFQVDGYGAVSQYQGGGIESVEQVGATTGTYDITLTDGWDYLFAVETQVVRATLASINGSQLLMDPATLQEDIKTREPLRIVLINDGVAEDPAEGDEIRFKIVARRTSVGPFDEPTVV